MYLLNNIKKNGLRVGAPFLYWSGYFDRILEKSQDRSFILMYHRVVNDQFQDNANIGIGIEHFEDQVRYIKNKMHPIAMRDLVGMIASGDSLPPKAVAITFDDGYSDVYDHAFPILNNYRVPATLFVTTGYISTSKILWLDQVREIVFNARNDKIFPSEFSEFWISSDGDSKRGVLSLGRGREAAYDRVIEWFKEMDSALVNRAVEKLRMILNSGDGNVERHTLATWEQVKEMSDYGIEIGTHTVNHFILGRLSEDELKYELRESKRVIEKNTGKEAQGLAIPYGQSIHFNEKVIQTAKNMGFRYVCTAITGSVFSISDVFLLKRISLPNSQLPIALWKICKYA